MAYDWSTDELGIGRRLADRATAQASGSAGTFPGTGIPREMLAKLIGAKALGEQPAADEPPTIEMPAEDVPRDVPIEMPAEDVRRASGVSVVPEQRPPVVINVNAAPPAGAPVASGVAPVQAPQVQPQAGSPAPSRGAGLPSEPDAPAPSGATPDPYSMAADMYGLAAQQGAAAGMDAGTLNQLEAQAAAEEIERARQDIDPLLERRMRAERAYQEDLMRQRERIASAVDAVSQTANPFSGPGGSDRIMAFAFAGIASEQFGVGKTLINIMEADASGRHAAAKERLAGLSDELAATMNVSKEVAASLDAQVAVRESQVIRRLQSVHAQLEPGRQKLAAEAAIAELYKDYGDRMLKIQKAQLDDEKTRAEIGKLESESRKNDALARKAGRGGGGGGTGGSGAHGEFVYSTGIFDPSTGQELFGRRKLTKKEHEDVTGTITAYAEYTNDLEELKDLLAEAGKQKSLGEQAWSRWKSTNSARFEFLRQKVVAGYAKVISAGYNPSQQMEERANAIFPDRQAFMSSVDPAMLFDDALRRADEGVVRTLRVRGVDGDIIVSNSRQGRIAPGDERPTPTPGIEESVAGTGGAEAPIRAAKESREQEVKQKRETQKRLDKNKREVDGTYHVVAPSRRDPGGVVVDPYYSRQEPVPSDDSLATPSLISAVETLNATRKMYTKKVNGLDAVAEEDKAAAYAELVALKHQIDKQTDLVAGEMKNLPGQTIRSVADKLGLTKKLREDKLTRGDWYRITEEYLRNQAQYDEQARNAPRAYGGEVSLTGRVRR